ncbi:nitrilase-like protein [Thermochaetoides thermophila DSM 1495]|uniref:Nitrilase-like protein n=1 Tax=Chaetomium thermophilum (strain DSM 1495 / CBS 144.50 / IMI 039719) TaxID=759272 RepID=G0S207_CHATD|nr:nitrilase-like protein [Thermochaetoides thermophila DSM 1495]EGS23067.1 nitrilase-like protein [Thermochaetoides thermophila DSM 1495]
MAPTTIRLGTASPATQSTTSETLIQLEHIARRAASKKIDILLLPEAYIGGYPRGSSFGCVVGSRSTEGRDEYLRYFQNAVDLGDSVGDGAGAGKAWINRELPSDVVPGSEGEKPSKAKRGDGTREELERIARETGVFIITGLIERAGGSLYCAVVYVCPRLGIIGKRRKVMPTGSERLIWAQGSPATLRAVSTTIRGVRINLAAAICWENYMPLPRRTSFVTEDGFEIALPGPSHSPRSSHSQAPPPPAARRRQSIFDEDGNEIVLPGPKPHKTPSPRPALQPRPAAVISSTSTHTPPKPEPAFLSRGGSAIVSPFGDVLAGPQWEDDEGLIWADVDFDDCVRGRLDLDAAGSYSRNDSFKLSVDGLDLTPLPYY